MSTRKAKASKSGATKKPSRPKAQVAKEEIAETPPERSVQWHGLTFSLPPYLPEAALLELAVTETSANPTSSYKLLKRFLGEEQFTLVINKVSDDDDVHLSDVAELLAEVFREYGTDEGE